VPQVEFRIESWDEFWPDGMSLMQEEFNEYANALGLWKPHEPDTDILEALVQRGLLVLMVARVNGAVGAYLWWVVDRDVESKGHTIYRQGPFYAATRFAKYSLGMKLLRRSLEMIRRNVVGSVEVDLHHPPTGRGAQLEKIFTAMGAREVATHYRLRVSQKD